MKPVCVKCQRFFRPAKTGTYFVENMPRMNGARPGTQAPEEWKPYKLWAGDKYRCDGCQTEIIVGFGRQPIAEHYQTDFKQAVTDFRATLTVNDC